MDELLAKSDFISVHAPAVDGGALINAERIAKMKDGVCIINTSRGTNVDEAALLAALESGKVRAAVRCDKFFRAEVSVGFTGYNKGAFGFE